jgi:cell fate (sporulation/competence/biofilm development) regulator YlbF (YheA/YmcA/DUF963 family)
MGGKIMETAISTLSILPSTKAQRQSFIEMAVNEILDGNLNPLQVELTLKSAIDTLEEIRKNTRVKMAVQEEADKYSEKTFEIGNFKVTKSSRTTNDFSGCDSHLDNLYAEMESLKAQIKARESLVKTGVDSSTGEVFKPVKSKVTEFLKIELVK